MSNVHNISPMVKGRYIMCTEGPHPLGKLIGDKRLLLGLTQADAAEKAGLNRTTYAELERGRIKACSVDHFIALASAFDMTPQDLLTEYLSKLQHKE